MAGFDYESLRNRLRRCKNMYKDDVIINADIFINKQYREQQKTKGLSYPIHFTTDIEKYKTMDLPTTFNYKSKQDL